LGIDFIQKHQLWYCPKNQSFTWEGQPNWGQEHLKVCNATIIPPLSVAYLKATICTKGGTLPGEGNLCIATVASSQHPLVTGGPYLVQPDTQGQITIPRDTLSAKKKQFIVENIKLQVPKQYQQQYLKLLYKITRTSAKTSLTLEEPTL